MGRFGPAPSRPESWDAAAERYLSGAARDPNAKTAKGVVESSTRQSWGAFRLLERTVKPEHSRCVEKARRTLPWGRGNIENIFSSVVPKRLTTTREFLVGFAEAYQQETNNALHDLGTAAHHVEKLLAINLDHRGIFQRRCTGRAGRAV
jgi:hypothetical protein